MKLKSYLRKTWNAISTLIYWTLVSAMTALYATTLILLVLLTFLSIQVSILSVFLTMFFVFLVINIALVIFPGESDSTVLQNMSDHFMICMMLQKHDSRLATSFSRYSRPEDLWYTPRNAKASIGSLMPSMTWMTVCGFSLCIFGIAFLFQVPIGEMDLIKIISNPGYLVVGGVILLGIFMLPREWLRVGKIFKHHNQWKAFWLEYWRTIRIRVLPLGASLEAVEASFWDSVIDSDDWIDCPGSVDGKAYDILRKKVQDLMEKWNLQDTIPNQNRDLEDYVDKLATYAWLRDFIVNNRQELSRIDELRNTVSEIEEDSQSLHGTTSETLVDWYSRLQAFHMIEMAPEVLKDLNGLEKLEDAKKKELFEYASRRIEHLENLPRFPLPPSVRIVNSIASAVSLIISLVVLFLSGIASP